MANHEKQQQERSAPARGVGAQSLDQKTKLPAPQMTVAMSHTARAAQDIPSAACDASHKKGGRVPGTRRYSSEARMHASAGPRHGCDTRTLVSLLPGPCAGGVAVGVTAGNAAAGWGPRSTRGSTGADETASMVQRPPATGNLSTQPPGHTKSLRQRSHAVGQSSPTPTRGPVPALQDRQGTQQTPAGPMARRECTCCTLGHAWSCRGRGGGRAGLARSHPPAG